MAAAAAAGEAVVEAEVVVAAVDLLERAPRPPPRALEMAAEAAEKLEAVVAMTAAIEPTQAARSGLLRRLPRVPMRRVRGTVHSRRSWETKRT